MTFCFKEAYKELAGFAKNHGEIIIEEHNISIPENVRGEFYRLFNLARFSLINDKLSDKLSESEILSKHYKNTESEVIRSLNLDYVLLSTDLRRFLENPREEMARGAFNPLFDTLKGNISIEDCETIAILNMDNIFKSFYEMGYQKWLVLSVILVLKVDMLFEVFSRELDEREKLRPPIIPIKENIPGPVETNHLKLNDSKNFANLITPDYIAHSNKLNQYFAYKFGIGYSSSIAKEAATTNREWFPAALSKSLDMNTHYIFLGEKPEDLALIADNEKIAQPDLIIECKVDKQLDYQEALNNAKLHHDILNPKNGSFLIFKDSLETEAEAQEEGIRVISAGFNRSQLEIMFNPINE